ncbi:MAG: 30S ribosomal protein S8e [Promethearchaeota archaeon]
MGRWQGRSTRKASGARLRPHRKKRLFELGRESAETLPGESKRKKVRSRGGNIKMKLLRGQYANITDPEDGKTQKVRIINVISNPATVDYQRRGVITKGATINTDIGKAKVTSRPGQHGIINAVLITE